MHSFFQNTRICLKPADYCLYIMTATMTSTKEDNNNTRIKCSKLISHNKEYIFCNKNRKNRVTFANQMPSTKTTTPQRNPAGNNRNLSGPQPHHHVNFKAPFDGYTHLPTKKTSCIPSTCTIPFSFKDSTTPYITA